MYVFNHNLRFLLKKHDLSQQKLADRLKVKRGRIAAYVEGSQPKDDFKKKIADFFDVELSRFLTVEMTDDNYRSFLTAKNEVVNVNIASSNYQNKTDILELLMSLKGENDPAERSRLVDECVTAIGKMMERENKLKDEINILQKDLLQIARKS